MNRLIISIVIAIGLCPPGFATDTKTDDGEQLHDPRQAIWDALRSRQASAETAEAVWSRDSLQTGAAASSKRGPLDRTRPRPKDVAVPAERIRLVLSKDRGRYEFSTLSHSGGNGPVPVRMIDAFDGAIEQRFTNATNGTGPAGEFLQHEEFDEWGNIHLQGLLLALRPLRAEMLRPSPERWQVEDGTTIIDGRRCVVLADRSAGHHRVRRVYFDIEQDFVPLRLVSEIAGRPSAQVDMQYERTEPPTWVPSSWTATLYYFGDPTSFENTQNTLETVTLGLDVPDDTFKIDYPPGTDLSVAVSGLPDRVLVADDGEWVPRRQAVAAETAGGWGTSYYLLAAVAAAALGVALLLWRRQTARV